jgi:hypothetical protein
MTAAAKGRIRMVRDARAMTLVPAGSARADARRVATIHKWRKEVASPRRLGIPFMTNAKPIAATSEPNIVPTHDRAAARTTCSPAKSDLVTFSVGAGTKRGSSDRDLSITSPLTSFIVTPIKAGIP